MVDIAGPVSIVPGDFTFKTGNSDDPFGWTTLNITPGISIRPGAGVGGSNRVEITFPDGAIKGTWLQIDVHAGADTGLPADDVFFFGNAVGESGTDATSARVDALDELATRAYMQFNGSTSGVGIGNAFDFNRDGFVNPSDLVIARNNITWFGNQLQLITPQPPIGPSFVMSTPAGRSPRVRTTLPPPSPAASPLLESEPVIVTSDVTPAVSITPLAITTSTSTHSTTFTRLTSVKVASPHKAPETHKATPALLHVANPPLAKPLTRLADVVKKLGSLLRR